MKRSPCDDWSPVTSPRYAATVASVVALLLGGCASQSDTRSDSAGHTTAPVAEAPATRGTSPEAGAGVDGTSSNEATTGASPQVEARPSVDAAQRHASALTAARAEVARLTTRQLAAQIVVPDLGSAAAGATGIRQGYGGVVVMRSALTPGPGVAHTAKAANARYSAAMKASGRGWPAFIAIDQEGGPVTRIDTPLTAFPAAMALGATGKPQLATEVGRASGAELRGLGFTVVMAPDADVTTPTDPTIGIRSPGSDPEAVGRIVVGYVRGYQDAGIVPVVKHFPGHGAVDADTHQGRAVLDASRAVLARRDLVPFRAAVAAGAPAVMTAHVVARSVDAKRPASQSQPVTTGLLRRELGFSGLVVTDALNMGAATAGLAPGEPGLRALEAGADVILMPTDPAATISALVRSVEKGRIQRSRLEESAARMIATLRSAQAVVPTAAPGSGRPVAQRVAAASVTQIGGRCGVRLVGPAVTVTGGTPSDRTEFVRAARARGLRIGGRGATRVALLGGGRYRAGTGTASGATTASGDVLVALDTPYGLARPATARIAAFGRTPVTFDAVADVLTGRVKAAGSLPVPVGSWPIGTRCG